MGSFIPIAMENDKMQTVKPQDRLVDSEECRILAETSLVFSGLKYPTVPHVLSLPKA